MKNFRYLVVLIIVLMLSTLSAFAINALSPRQVDAQETDCSQFVVGTYLTTVTTPPGIPSYRELLTFSQDGNFFATDSNEYGVPGTSNQIYQPLSDTRGRWKCVEQNKITVTALNFDYPTGNLDTAITRDVYHVTFEPTTQTVQGTTTLTFFPLNANPLDGNQGAFFGPVTASFTGQQINALD